MADDYLHLMSQHDGRALAKWSNYPQIYDFHLARFRGKAVRVLEIGIDHGGSLQLLKRYLGDAAVVVGLDINPACKNIEEEGFIAEIGDQGNVAWLLSMAQKHGPFDIVIDDGSHRSIDQIKALETLWPYLQPHGVYVCEDTHASYWPHFGYGVRHPASFIEYCKDLIDQLHRGHVAEADRGKIKSSLLTEKNELTGVHFYESVVVLGKRPPTEPSVPIANGVKFAYPVDVGSANLHGWAIGNLRRVVDEAEKGE